MKGTILMTAQSTIEGNLAETPRKFGDGSNPGLELRVLVRTGRTIRGEFVEDEVPTSFTLVAWGHMAQHAAATFDTGDRILATVQPFTEAWKTEADEPRRTTKYRIESLGASVRFGNVTIDRAGRARKTAPDADVDQTGMPAAPPA